MIIRSISISILFFLICGCYNENKVVAEPPDPLLTEEQMIEILTDIQIAEAIIANNRVQRTNTEQHYKDSLYQVIFDNYKLTSKEINANIDYYNTDPNQMEKIYEKVLSNLSKRQSEIEEKAKKKAEESKEE
jgi:hypothetical protein